MASNYSFKPRQRDAAAGTPKQLVGKKWQKLKKLGNGCFGTVYLGAFSDGSRIAAKQIQLKSSSNEQLMQEMRRIAKEMAVLEKVTGEHKNIVRYFGCSFSSKSKSVYLLTQFIEGPTLQSYVLQLGRGMSEDETRSVTKQLLSALVFVHAKGILHKDVKPDNVMIRESDRVVKLIDFGIAGIAGHRRDSVGPPMYSAPEVANHSLPMTTRCDSFSLGLTVYFMLTAGHPLAKLPGLFRQMAMFDLSRQLPGLDSDEFSDDVCDFYQRSTVKDPRNRASCSELLTSQFIVAGRSEQPSGDVVAKLMLVLRAMQQVRTDASRKEYTVDQVSD